MTKHPERDLSPYIERGIEDARRLCAQPTIAAQGLGIEETARLVEGLLVDMGFATQWLCPSAGSPVIYGELQGTGPFTLLLYNHYDVQPPEPLALWDSPPFEPTVRNGKLYARGISDDKGEIAARLAAVRALMAEYGTLPLTIKWILEGEEEVGSPNFGEIAERYGALFQADGCLWEGAGRSPSGRPELCLGVKGLLYVELHADLLAQDAHSGLAPILPSAAWRLVHALASLKDKGGSILIPGFGDDVRPPSLGQLAALEDEPDTSESLRDLYGIDAFVDGLSGVALRERAAFGPTCNIAGVWSGYTGEGVKTVLPAEASAKLDFRLVPDQRPARILELLRNHLDAGGFDDVSVTQLGAAGPVVTPLDAPFVQKVMAITEAHYGVRPSVRPLSGGSLPLLQALEEHTGVPGLFAPGHPGYWRSGAHAPNEHIRLDDFGDAVRFLSVLFADLGSSL